MTRHMATVLALLTAGVLSMLLFTVKHQVQDLESEMTGLNRSILNNEQAFHVLKAEWSHLNDPRRLRGMASRHLGLSPVAPEQFGSAAALEMKNVPPAKDQPVNKKEDDFVRSISSALADGKNRR
ncbi:MAG: hypothetical protein A3G18_07080 [Rhodospirillales bacterium RIFCSPLOWO2_12_FULL_58_28]|nr:MAG: hypothetical protein A3H92_11810 [Rhodospirillales bacterium RIFCSPLOWO2_02_FULL_58_16]OHC78637.1 MAG: hypothetical protein A3G18_07080 [Rhodospirillales bacterium RIFCSPLOWO2_12_FULL_58_28]